MLKLLSGSVGANLRLRQDWSDAMINVNKYVCMFGYKYICDECINCLILENNYCKLVAYDWFCMGKYLNRCI